MSALWLASPARKIDGFVIADTNGTHSILEVSALLASISGLRRNASRALAGYCETVHRSLYRVSPKTHPSGVGRLQCWAALAQESVSLTLVSRYSYKCPTVIPKAASTAPASDPVLRSSAVKERLYIDAVTFSQRKASWVGFAQRAAAQKATIDSLGIAIIQAPWRTFALVLSLGTTNIPLPVWPLPKIM
jgi:hypothetical protein